MFALIFDDMTVHILYHNLNLMHLAIKAMHGACAVDRLQPKGQRSWPPSSQFGNPFLKNNVHMWVTEGAITLHEGA